MPTAGPRYLVTGGAGYVGSHTVLALREAGADVTVVDNLSTGHRAALPPDVPLVVADVEDTATLSQLVADGGFSAILHFAALSLVGESMRQPTHYLRRNLLATLALIDVAIAAGIRKFVLSSTANIFSGESSALIEEYAPVDPGSPYGESKAMAERALHWADRIHGLRSACLRYFNAAGADPAGRIGEDHRPETHLIPAAIDAVLGRRPPLCLFGTDYPTSDGTCIRDYVHVSDIARAHLAALDLLDHRSVALNIGTGRGASVREVLAAIGEVAGHAVPVIEAARRPGDPASLVADGRRLVQLTGWTPSHSQLTSVIETAFAWRKANPHGYPG